MNFLCKAKLELCSSSQNPIPSYHKFPFNYFNSAYRILLFFLLLFPLLAMGQGVTLGTETCTLPNGTTISIKYISRDDTFVGACHEDVYIEVEICGDPGNNVQVDLNLDADWHNVLFQDQLQHFTFSSDVTFQTLSLEPGYDPNAPCQTYKATFSNNSPPTGLDAKNISNIYVGQNGNTICNLDTPVMTFLPSTDIIASTYGNSLKKIIENSVLINKEAACSSTAHKNLTLIGDLNIDTHYCLKNIDLHMLEGASITVKNGYTLTIEESKITYCNVFWKSITVERHAKLEVINSVIEGAENAIIVKHHAQIGLEQVQLLDNRDVSIRFQDENHFMANCFLGPFEGVKMKGTGLYPNWRFTQGGNNVILPWTKKPATGIYVSDFSFLNLAGNFDVQSQVFGNSKLIQYENLQNGIISLNCAQLDVGFSTFKNVDVGVDVRAIGFEDFQFNYNGLKNVPGTENFNFTQDFFDVGTGIRVFNSNVSIQNAEFDEIRDIGIHLDRNVNRNMDIRSNTINSHGKGIASDFSFPSTALIERCTLSTLSGHGVNIVCNNGWFGFSDQEGSSWDIVDNIINNEGGNGSAGISILGGNNFNLRDNEIDFSSSRGTGIWTLYSPDITMHKNIIKGLENGSFTAIRTQHTASGEYTENVMTGGTNGAVFHYDNGRNDFRCNTMTDFETGLSLGSNAIIGPQWVKYNCWEDNAKDLVHAGMQEPVVSKSRFTVLYEGDQDTDCHVPPNYKVSSGTGNINDFYIKAFGSPNSICGSPTPPPYPPDDYLRDLVQNNLYDVEKGAALNWMSQYMNYLVLSNIEHPDSELQNEIDVFLFSSEHLENFFELWYEFENLNTRQYRLPISFNNIIEQIKVLEDEINTGLNPSEMDILIGQRSDLIEIMESLNSGFEASYDQKALEYLDQRIQLMNDLIVLRTSNDYELNLKNAMIAYLKLTTDGPESFTEAEWVDLFNIASQCPANGGTGTFLARSLYLSYKSVDFSIYNNCPNPEFREIKSGDKEQLIIIPNPGQGLFKLVLPEASDLRLISQFGTKIADYSLEEGENFLDLGHLLPGVYYFTSYSNQPSKLVIIK